MTVTLFSTLLLVATLSPDPAKIAKVNKLKKEAKVAFMNKNYEEAILKYTLLDSLSPNDESIKLNLAHAYYMTQDTLNAKNHYNDLSYAKNNTIKSIAYQQLGVISKEEKKLDDALRHLKKSLKANPINEEARYNYELVKKLLNQQNSQNQKQQNKDNQNQENKDNQNQDNQDKKDKNEKKENSKKDNEKSSSEKNKDDEKQGQENQSENQENQEKKDKEKEAQQRKQKLEQIQMSEEKAKMILEAMRNNEIQYLQQQKRKSTQKPDSDKPDW